MDAELAVMASSAATTMVSLMATDAWGQAKERVAMLWRRFRPEQADGVEAELDQARLELAADADETITLALVREWESRLLRLLAADDAVAAELSRLTAELKQIPAGQQPRGVVWQQARASGQSTVIQIGGNGTIGTLPSGGPRSATGGMRSS